MKRETQVQSVRFAPSRVEGLAAVAEVVVWRDRIELLSEGRWVTYRFSDIACWPRPWWLWKFLFNRGVRPKWLPVADHD
jgi:hypothetical protein